MAPLAIARALNMGLRKALETDPKVIIMGEDVQARRRIQGHRRPAQGLRRRPRHGHPACGSGIIGTAIGWRWRVTGRSARSSSTASCFPLRPDREPAREVALPVAGNGHDASRRPHSFGGGIGAVEHHSESPEALFAHVAGLRRWPAQCCRRLHDDPAGVTCTTRSSSSSPSAATGTRPTRRRKRDSPTPSRCMRPGCPAGPASDPAGLRPDGEDLPRRR